MCACADLSPMAIYKHTELHRCNIAASRGNIDSNKDRAYCLLGQHALTIDGLVAILPCVLICLPGQYISIQNCMAVTSPQAEAIWTQIGPCYIVCWDNTL